MKYVNFYGKYSTLYQLLIFILEFLFIYISVFERRVMVVPGVLNKRQLRIRKNGWKSICIRYMSLRLWRLKDVSAMVKVKNTPKPISLSIGVQNWVNGNGIETLKAMR